MIHIMKRTGDHSRALQAINESDILTVEDAIAYCKDVDEQFLWDQLIESSKVKWKIERIFKFCYFLIAAQR